MPSRSRALASRKPALHATPPDTITVRAPVSSELVRILRRSSSMTVR
jgi:hypothetical protein